MGGRNGGRRRREWMAPWRLGMESSVAISDAVAAELRAKARAAGVNLEAYAARQLERVAAIPENLEAISGPIVEAFKASGMTEDELSDLLETEKHAMLAERRKRKSV